MPVWYNRRQTGAGDVQIVVATDVTVAGGVDRYVLALMVALRRAGHVAVLVCEQRSASPLASQSRRYGFSVKSLPLYRQWYAAAEVEAACVTVLTQIRPDGVHVVTGSPRSCLPLRAAAITRGVPLMITESQVDEDLVLTDSQRSAIRHSYAGAAAVVFVSAGNRETMLAATGCTSVRSVVIRNGVDIAHFEQWRRGCLRPSRPARLITVARLSPEKSIDTLVAAVCLLPDDLVREAVVFGDGPCRNSLSGQIEALGQTSRVVLAGWDGAVAARLCEFDLFVLPSVAEGMPYALLEAMAVGLPIVCSDVPGNVEAVAGGAAGLVVTRGDAEALAAGIAHSLRRPADTEARTQSALQRVRRHHDLTTAMDRTARLWYGLLQT